MRGPLFLQDKALYFLHGKEALRHLHVSRAMHKCPDVPNGKTKTKQENKAKKGRGKRMCGGEPTPYKEDGVGGHNWTIDTEGRRQTSTVVETLQHRIEERTQARVNIAYTVSSTVRVPMHAYVGWYTGRYSEC